MYIGKKDNKIVYEVELTNPENLMVLGQKANRSNLEQEAKKHTIKLLLFEDEKTKKILYASYMLLEKHSTGEFEKLHYKNLGNFTGTVLYYHFTGQLANGWNYANGRIAEKIAVITEKQFDQLQTQTQGDIRTEATVCQSGFADKYQWTCVGVPGYENCGFTYVGQEYVTYCSYEEEDKDYLGNENESGRGYFPPEYTDCAGVAGGTATWNNECNTCIGGTTGLTACPKDIRNKAEDPCISTVVNELVGANKNIEGKISEIIKKFDQSKDLNLNIYDGITANGKPGNMFRSQLRGSEFTADIRLQTSYFKGEDGASKESLAAVLIHEVLHSYIKSQNPNILDTNNVHHNMMVQNYIEPMSNYLTSAFGISRKDAFSLTWNGVIDSDVFEMANSEKLFEYTYTENGVNHTISVSKQEIMNRASAYNGNTNYADEGKKGTKTCPN
ncbi:hypothetical protein [Pedobacter sp. SL55]|uniref:hypothetical protein n=1 Tax=Pedobacter sp. SL55 TaxID=2995161 RepID=UPI002271C05E|nr:hypothetical protein [Pedobacter sp. SL55]WAC41193.1 hypothetical protein OVA16_02120 [Pedobacter sp. SL55]